MRYRSNFITLLLTHLACSATVESAAPPRILLDHRALFENSDRVDVLIRYNNELGKAHVEQACESTRQGTGLKRVNAIQASLTYPELEKVMYDTNIDFIEENPTVKLLGDVESYGLTAIRRGKSQTSIPDAKTTGSCSDSNTLKVALVDSGVDISHPDLACGKNNCIGQSFGIGSLEWSKPSDSHGTGVAGIIGATRGNGVGLDGVVDGRSICWIIARVFASTTSSASMDAVMEGIEWSVEQGARVMNLSLGGKTASKTAQLFYQDLQDRGVVVVAAAGNDGDTDKFYPASFDTVVSVAAVDHANKRAFFSQSNNEVNIAAPGAGVLSTATRGSKKGFFLNIGTEYSVRGDPMQRSRAPVNGQAGVLVDCGDGQNGCQGASGGHFCLIKRTVGSYSSQAKNCEAGNGVAAIIYNNDDGPLEDKVESSVNIPVIGVSKVAGELFKRQLGKVLTLSIEDGYGSVWGTSYAAPFVSGAIAASLQACPHCSNSQVLLCMEESALDLGSPGRDDDFGSGLVQVEGTYLCLLNNLKCCGDDTSQSGPSPSPPPPSPPPQASCKGKLMAARACLNKRLDEDESDKCRTCINGNLPGAEATCEDAESQMCSSFQKCDCGVCQDIVEDYYTCAYQEKQGCTFQCESEPLNQTPKECSEKLSVARTCLVSTSGAGECKECINSKIPSRGSSCDHSESQMCSAFDSCPCGSCHDAVVDYFTCTYRDEQGCPFDCTGPLGTASAMSSSPVENLGVGSAKGLYESSDEPVVSSQGGEGSLRATSSVAPVYLSSVLIFLSGVITLCVS